MQLNEQKQLVKTAGTMSMNILPRSANHRKCQKAELALSKISCFRVMPAIYRANKTHFEVGKKVRQTISELGGTMPEDLPTPEKSVKQIEKEHENKKIENKE